MSQEEIERAVDMDVFNRFSKPLNPDPEVQRTARSTWLRAKSYFTQGLRDILIEGYKKRHEL